ncbi:uncharacterized protein LOC135605669 [Musa acuminata AAA Group]|uniref:uncharacterized protein LOC135605669 n=1 Tax=Musa acuminata AAA Group TaxID=214697 RepID=UPI0031DCF28E
MGRSDGPRGMKRRRRSSGSAFAVGAKVEVRSDEDGFRGAWYEATVVRQLSQRRFEVVYAFLVEDHDPSQPLREVVQRSNLRPQPPPLLAADAASSGGGRYSLHDLVEAFHNDGWWAGVIFAVLHGPTTSRYLVSFPTSREEVVFEESQMRPQLQWVRGRWVPVDEQRAEDPAFSSGAQVEVSRDRENYGAAWFGASVVEVFNSTTVLVEYENLKAENNDELLREIVDAQYIRTCQPNAALVKDFALNDEVEVLHHGGWVPGMISKIVNGSKYIIKMLHDENETEFGHAELRLRRFWNGQQWVFKSQMTSTALTEARSTGSKRNSHSGKRYHLPISVSTSSDDDDVDVDVTCEPGSTNLSLKHKKAEGQLECSQVCNNMKKVDSLEYSMGSPCSSLLVGYPATPMTEINLSVAMPMIEYSSSVEKHHSESPFLGEIADMANVGTTLPPNPLLDEHLNAHKNGLPKIPVRDEVSPRNSGNGSEHQSKVTQVSGAPISHEINGFFQYAEQRNSEGVHGSSLNITKGRRKLIIKAPRRLKMANSDDSVRQQAQDETQRRPSIVDSMRCFSSMCASIRCEPINSNKSVNEVFTSDGSRDKNELSGCLCQATSPLCQQNDVLLLQGNTPILDVVGNSRIRCLVAQSLPDVVSSSLRTTCGGILNNARVYTVDQIIPSVIGESCTEINHNKAPSETVIFESMGALIDPISTGSPLKEELMPFSKTSSMWEPIESMEIFQVMPQQPHFHPLEQYSMEFREGMAIGLMISFANLVANIQQIHIDDAQATIEGRLRALSAFEANGFNVHCLRSRLQDLLEMHVNRRQCETRKAALKVKMLEKKDDNERLDSLIAAFDKAILELEQNLASFRDKKDSVIRERSSNDSEISKLQVNILEAEVTYNSAEENFKAILSAPW